jgi:hypothetical protein
MSEKRVKQKGEQKSAKLALSMTIVEYLFLFLEELAGVLFTINQ